MFYSLWTTEEQCREILVLVLFKTLQSSLDIISAKKNLNRAHFRNEKFFMLILIKVLLPLGIYNERELGGGCSRTVYLLNNISTITKYRYIHLLTNVEITTVLFSELWLLIGSTYLVVLITTKPKKVQILHPLTTTYLYQFSPVPSKLLGSSARYP